MQQVTSTGSSSQTLPTPRLSWTRALIDSQWTIRIRRGTSDREDGRDSLRYPRDQRINVYTFLAVPSLAARLPYFPSHFIGGSRIFSQAATHWPQRLVYLRGTDLGQDARKLLRALGGVRTIFVALLSFAEAIDDHHMTVFIHVESARSVAGIVHTDTVFNSGLAHTVHLKPGTHVDALKALEVHGLDPGCRARNQTRPCAKNAFKIRAGSTQEGGCDQLLVVVNNVNEPPSHIHSPGAGCALTDFVATLWWHSSTAKEGPGKEVPSSQLWFDPESKGCLIHFTRHP
ncbi:hypothetical protein C8R44DRAFT_747144 [Mycena epipterygia]|nr:hypothetical protein C8R44DRAFT_747144 [Mycena epipterygia]